MPAVLTSHPMYVCDRLQTVVDIATLTGAAGIALGQDTGALFANDDALAASLDAASRRAGALAS